MGPANKGFGRTSFRGRLSFTIRVPPLTRKMCVCRLARRTCHFARYAVLIRSFIDCSRLRRCDLGVLAAERWLSVREELISAHQNTSPASPVTTPKGASIERNAKSYHDYLSHQIPADAKAVARMQLPPLMPDFAKAQDAIGTVHYSRFLALDDETLLFLADIDGDVETLSGALAKSAGPVFDTIFKHVDGPASHAGGQQPSGFHRLGETPFKQCPHRLRRFRQRFGSGHQVQRSRGWLYG